MTNAAWTPQPGPQLGAIEATWCEVLLFGGARGGGKSDFLLGDFLQDVDTYGSAWQGILFRKTYNELEEIIKRSHEIFGKIAKWLATKKTWIFPSGATLKLRFVEREEDAEKYQGHSYTWIGFDELGNWASNVIFKKLIGCLRNATTHVDTKRIRCSANPGGVGHHWVKRFFIDHAPLGFTPKKDEDSGMNIMFIPSRVTDNEILMKKDPNYINRLKSVGSPELVKAWLLGDWSVVTGAYFSEFNMAKHVIAPFKLPDNWLRIGGFDWGSSKPFCYLWGAISDGTILPRGSIIIYNEYYGCSEPNVGLKLDVKQVAQGIHLRNHLYPAHAAVADPSIFKEEGGFSLANEFEKNGVKFQRADNTRKAGWQLIRQRLIGEDDKPTIYFFGTCEHIIRTLPAIQHDKGDPEDVDTDGEDHALDALRYLVNTRGRAKDIPQPVKPLVFTNTVTINDCIKYKERQRKKFFRSRI